MDTDSSLAHLNAVGIIRRRYPAAVVPEELCVEGRPHGERLLGHLLHDGVLHGPDHHSLVGGSGQEERIVQGEVERVDVAEEERDLFTMLIL